MPGWVAVSLEQIPRAAGAERGANWYPLQHAFGLTAFGANVFVADEQGTCLINRHDERESGQEELYLVVLGRAGFTIAGEQVEAPAVTAVAVRDPSLTRSAAALEPGTILLALGGVPQDGFRSTWMEEHFEGVDRLI
jgi:hypothetical protein